ncbi:hypothetical protein [Tsukamurella soli]|uniref:Protein phosphatase 2C n=1 Tax=Tsukamurella soli TaxID=644556 RepID=A0ABP8J7G0_9ACTN
MTHHTTRRAAQRTILGTTCIRDDLGQQTQLVAVDTGNGVRALWALDSTGQPDMQFTGSAALAAAQSVCAAADHVAGPQDRHRVHATVPAADADYVLVVSSHADNTVVTSMSITSGHRRQVALGAGDAAVLAERLDQLASSSDRLTALCWEEDLHIGATAVGWCTRISDALVLGFDSTSDVWTLTPDAQDDDGIITGTDWWATDIAHALRLAAERVTA